MTGVLLALPAAAVIMVLLREAKDRYKSSDLYNAEDEHDHPNKEVPAIGDNRESS